MKKLILTFIVFSLISCVAYAQDVSSKIVLSEEATIHRHRSNGWYYGGGDIRNPDNEKLFHYSLELRGYSTNQYSGGIGFDKLELRLELTNWRPESREKELELESKQKVMLGLPYPDELNYVAGGEGYTFVNIYKNDYLRISIKPIGATRDESTVRYESLEIEIKVEQTKYLD